MSQSDQLTQFNNKVSVVIPCRNEEGFIENQEVDLSSLTDNFQIQEGDVIFVPKTNVATAFDSGERSGSVLSRFFNIINFIFGIR